MDINMGLYQRSKNTSLAKSKDPTTRAETGISNVTSEDSKKLVPKQGKIQKKWRCSRVFIFT